MLLHASERDFEALRAIRHSDKVSDKVFGFHVQQAAEKSPKARLAVLGEVYPFTQNIALLLAFLDDRDVTTTPFCKLIDYTPYAVEFRYAGVDSNTEPINRESALALVGSLLQQVRLELAGIQAT